MTTAQIIEFLLFLLIAASLIALVTRRLRVPYTIALVLGGFAIDLFHLPIAERFGEGASATHVLSPDVIFILFLPALLFEAGLNIQVGHLRRSVAPIALLAVAGVLVATVVTGAGVTAAAGLPWIYALLFGALISATDPISVLALFKDMGVDKRLSIVVEGESLFNDGTAVVVFQILLAGALSGSLGVAEGVGRFLMVVAGGAALGTVVGYLASKLTAQVDDPSIEITLTTIVAYGSYLLAEHLHVSGVIATVAAGLMVGNFGAETGMSARTRVALWSFWEYLAFVCNSLVFLLIGIEVHVVDLLRHGWAIAAGVVAVLVGRALAVYLLTPLSNRFSEPIPFRWQHVLVWGGLHGGVSMALALGLPADLPHRDAILAMTFGVVAFSLVVQGLTVKPLMRLLGIRGTQESAYDLAKVRRAAVARAREELARLRADHAVSGPVAERLEEELERRLESAEGALSELASGHPELAGEETRLVRLRLVAAEKAAVQRAVADGLITPETAESLLHPLDERVKGLTRGHGEGGGGTAEG